MQAQILFCGMAVSELEAAHAWYGQLFGRPADVLVNDDEVMWRVAADAGWLYVVVDPPRAGRGLAAISLADLDAELRTLHARGLEPALVAEVGEGSRKATFYDPDDNLVAVIEVPG